MTEGEAAPAADAGQGSRNLTMRVLAAAVLAPAAIAIVYAGGWLWAGLVTLAAIGLYVEWLTIVDTRSPRVMAAGIGDHNSDGCKHQRGNNAHQEIT